MSSADYLGDLIYGANDGIVTTFAVIAGVAGASLSDNVVLVLGIANLLADGFSMAASNYLAIRSKGLAELETTTTLSEPILSGTVWRRSSPSRAQAALRWSHTFCFPRRITVLPAPPLHPQ